MKRAFPAKGATMIVFLTLAGIGLFLLLVSAFSGHHMDFHSDIDHGGFGFLSVRAFAAFFTAFGTVGAIGRHYGLTTGWSSVWGLASGVGLVGLYVVSMELVKSQQASSLIAENELVGLTARVTVAIPADGIGEVSCIVKAQTARRMAHSRSGLPIGEGHMVRVIELQGDVCLVEPLTQSQA
jgi:membrane-bound ClpP family serine protease